MFFVNLSSLTVLFTFKHKQKFRTNSFKDIDDYYNVGSINGEKLLKIKTPTLILMADDDRISDYKSK